MSTKSIKGTQTEKNLVASYVAESTAYSRYTFYAAQADKELFFPIGETFRTATNLRISANEEMVEGVQMYTDAAKVADEEGFPEIASHFRAIAEIENRHHARFEAYIKQIETGTVWKREVPIKWQCLVCGYVYEGLEPPKVCPACDHPYQHYIALDMDEL